MSHIEQEIELLFDHLSRAKSHENEAIATDLQQLYLKNSGYYDKIFQSLQKLINSKDLNEKYNGLIGLESVSYVVQENQYMNFWNSFYSLVFQQFQPTVEEKHLKKTAEVFGRLLRVGGTRIANVLPPQIQSAIQWLQSKASRENRKYAGLLVLKELLDQAPFDTLKVILSTYNYHQNIWSLIKNKNTLLREAALVFFDALLKQISLKECKQRRGGREDVSDKEFKQIYSDISQSMASKDEEIVVGNISAVKILLSYTTSDRLQEGQFVQICNYVLGKKDASSPLVQSTVIDALPILSRFNKMCFEEKFFATTVEHLLARLNPVKQKYLTYELATSYYDTLHRICENMEERQMDLKRRPIFKQIEKIVEAIIKDLHENKAYIPSRISCFMVILSIFQKNYSDIVINENQLINIILFNGLYPHSIEFLKQIQKIHAARDRQQYLMQSAIKKEQKQSSMQQLSLHKQSSSLRPKKKIENEVSNSIQYRLLLCIITILSKHRNVIPQSLAPQNENDKRFYDQILSVSGERNMDEKAIANAIQTLSTFGFSKYENELANFVKDNVLDYLDNKNKNIRKAAAKAGCLLYVKKKRGQLISKNIMYEILEKFMSVAISDPVDEIRQTMLKSLNENFDEYLNEPNYLKKLFLCVNDSNIQVQQLVLIILCRLSRYNPADINPFLKKTLFEFLSKLSFNDVESEKQMINLLSSLGCLIKNGGELVKPHTQSIAKILLNFLKDQNVTNNMIPELLKTFSQLSSLGDSQILLYMDEIFPIFLQAMQDKSSTAKREAAVKSLVDILKNTGFVVLPYYKYPSFLETLLQLMKNEVNVEMRLQCMRLIGCVGAVDNFYFKKVTDRLKSSFTSSPDHDNRMIINEIISKSLKKKFNYFKKFRKAKQLESSSDLSKQLHQYYQDILLLETFKQKKMFLKLANMQSGESDSEGVVATTADSKKEVRNQNMIEKLFSKQEIDEEIKVLLQAPTVISLNDEDYFSRITLKALLKVLCDSSLGEHHKLTVQTLSCIIGVLKTKTCNFLDLLIPVFSKILKQDILREPEWILDLIESIIKHCGNYDVNAGETISIFDQYDFLDLQGRQYDQEYLDPVISIFLEYIKDPSYFKICLSILDNLVDLQKRNLRHKIEPIIRHTIKVISKPQIDIDLVIKTLRIYGKLGELLDSNVHLIIPFLCMFIKRDPTLVPIILKIEITKLFSCLANTCSSTVQFLSLIVEAILHNLEQPRQTSSITLSSSSSSSQQQAIHAANTFVSSLMDAVVVFIHQYKNQFLVYLTKLNLLVKQQNINHIAYQKCLEIFLNNGNLDDIPLQISAEYNMIVGEQKSSIYQSTQLSEEPNRLVRTIESTKLERVFDTSSNTSKEDWNQWMSKTAKELLKESPSFVLSPCHQLAEIYEELQAELYNISFACVWSQLKDKEKEQIINHLTRAINPGPQSSTLSYRESDITFATQNNSSNVPISILQTILNLAEFMQHDKEGVQIDNGSLGGLAERCLAYAKALHYRENEFETANEQTIESLISLYTNLGQREPAKGLLQYMQKQLRLDVNMSWYERLHQWEYALDDYRVRQLNLPDQNYFVPKLRCLNALSDWDQLIKSVEDEPENENIKQVMHLAANAAMNMGKWDLLEKFTEQLPEENNQDKTFWQAAICISKGQYEDSKALINESILKLDSQVSGLLLESYGRAQESILRLQQLFEMQEIIEIKEFQDSMSAASSREGLSKGSFEKELTQMRQALQEKWADRLSGNPNDIETWQKILSVRQLLFTKKDDLNSWLKFCRLAMKNNQLQMCKKILDDMSTDFTKSHGEIPPILQLANFECTYQMTITKDNPICLTMEHLLTTHSQLDSKIQAKTFLKMGNWIREKTEELTETNMKQIEEFYCRSKEFKPDYYKAWHHFALLNFDAINISGTNKQQKDEHIKSALAGFMRSITLGTSSEHKSPFLLQDSLRLLSLIFDYGETKEIHDIFMAGFKQIHNRAWIEVVPQIIARISTTKEPVQRILHALLIHIAKEHPQALIYPLTVACKSKVQIRQQAADLIMKDIMTQQPTLVQQALLVSAELNRTAILLKEQWHEGIKEAWERYMMEKGGGSWAVIKMLLGLHEMMRESPPESLSEISFHQNFGNELAEAESWLLRYHSEADAICLCQAFDIYYRIYMKLGSQLEKLEVVYLENVSPKLLATKNCEIAVPGTYKATRPIVKIACFQPKLDVFFSKMHPRKLFLYGSDSKEYHFLLKGREDIRQDERVMQLFALINRLLHNNPETERKDLNITRYSIIPLSINTGLLGWVHNCDTLQLLIREYRKAYNIRENPESNLMENFASNYSVLPLANKVEIFKYVIGETKGEDLKKVLWLKSPNSEIWLERRTNYTRSLATMSIAGYILGLGDRHPSNIMLQRQTGKIVHIDFGDCFEVAMRRDKFPEKVPFRLTRMLVNAMEACQIEGNYRNTCELVMKVIRENKESLIAVLEAFVYDPLFYWRLVTISGEQTADDLDEKDQSADDSKKKAAGTKKQQHGVAGSVMNSKKRASRHQSLFDVTNGIPTPANNNFVGSVIQYGTSLAIKKAMKKTTKNMNQDKDHASSPSAIDKESKYYDGEEDKSSEQQQGQQYQQQQPKEIFNQKALEVIKRIKKKLNGKDFKENEQLSYIEQVNKLINQATSHENICQAYIGWCPFW